MKRQASIPVVQRKAYLLFVELDSRITHYPVNARAMLGRRILDSCLDLLEALNSSSFQHRGSPAQLNGLKKANELAALLRLLLRASRDRRYLSENAYEHLIRKIDEIGRMVGGWLRNLDNPR